MEDVSLRGGGGFLSDGMVGGLERGYNWAGLLYKLLCPFSRDIIPNFFLLT